MKLDRSQMEKLIQVILDFDQNVLDKLKEKDKKIIRVVKEAFDKQESSVFFDSKINDFNFFLIDLELKLKKEKCLSKIERLNKLADTLGVSPNFDDLEDDRFSSSDSDSELKEKFEKEKELKPFEILHPARPSSIPWKTTPIDASLFAHIHADEFGGPSSFEGINPEKPTILPYVTDFLHERVLNSLPLYGLSIKDLELLQRTYADGLGSNLDKEALKAAISNGQPFVILGGWIGSPVGHAIFYEIIPEKDSTITFRLYNLGAGAEKSNETHAHPVVEWRGISKDKFQNTDIFKEHLTLAHFGKDRITSDYNENDIYKGLKSYLDPKEILFVDSKEGRPLKMQRAGYCTYRSLLAFLSTRMDDSGFKRFKIDIKLHSLRQFQNELDYRGAAFEEKQLLEKSIRKFSRSLLRLRNENIVDDLYLEYALSIIEKGSHPIADKEALPPVASPIEKARAHTLTSLPYPMYLKDAGISQTTDSYQHLWHELKTLDLKDPSVFHKIDTFREKAMKAWEKGANYEPYLLLEELIRNLPDDFWVSGVENETVMQERMLLLSQLLKDYFKTCFTNPLGSLLTPEKVFVTFKVFYLQTQLASLFNKASMEELNLFLSLDKLPGLEFFSLKPEEKIALTHYIESLESRNSRSNPKPLRIHYASRKTLWEPRSPSKGNGFSVKNYSMKNDLKQKSFQNFVSTYFPEVLSKAKEKDKGFHYYHIVKQEALLLASDEFPDWFKTTRETFLLASYLLEESLAYEPTLDRTLPMEFSFKHVDGSYNVRYEKYSLHATYWNQPFDLHATTKETLYPYLAKPQGEDAQKTLSLVSAIKDFREKNLLNLYADRKAAGFLQDLPNPSKATIEFIQKLGYVALGDQISLISLLELFLESPHLMNDPNMQIHFQKIFLENKAYFKEPWVAKRINLFFQKMQTMALEDNQIKTCVFMYTMKRYRDSYTEENHIQEELNELRGLLELSGLDIETKKAIYAEMLGCFNQMEKLKSQDLEDLVLADLFLRQNPFPSELISVYQRKEIHDCFLKKSTEIKEHFIKKEPEEINSFCNDLAEALDPSFKISQWELSLHPEDSRPIFSTDTLVLDLLKREMKIQDKGSLQKIPEEILLNHKNFTRLYPNVKEGTLSENGSFHFLDSDEKEVAVFLKEGMLQIEKNLFGDNEPFVLASENKFIRSYHPILDEGKDKSSFPKPLLPSLSLVYNFDIWLSQPKDGRVLLVLTDKKTKEPLYKKEILKVEEDYYTIDPESPLVRIRDGAQIFKAKQTYAHFEEPNYTNEIFAPEGARELEFSRLGLIFKTSGSENKLYIKSDSLEGFYIDEEATFNTIRPYKHYLILRNDEGEKKLILPFHHAVAPKEKKDVFTIKYLIDLETDSKNLKSQIFYVYDLKGDQPIGNSRASLLYLAEVYLLNQKYKEAYDLLNRYGRKLSVFTNEERVILEKLASINEVTGNNEGDALGIQLLAAYLLVKNSSNFPKKGKKTTKNTGLELLQVNFNEYLKSQKNSTFVILKPEEEKEIRRFIKTNLKSEETTEASISTFSKIELPSLFPEWYAFQGSQYQAISFTITRAFHPQEKINFFKSYQIAKNTSAESAVIRERLKNAVTYAKDLPYFESERSRILLLEKVLQRPDLFPSLPDNYDSSFENEIVKITNQLLAKEKTDSNFEFPVKTEIVKDPFEKKKPLPDRAFEPSLLSSQDKASILKDWKKNIEPLSKEFLISFDLENHSVAVKERERGFFFESLFSFYRALSSNSREKSEHPQIQSQTDRLEEDLAVLKKSEDKELREVYLDSITSLKGEILEKSPTAQEKQSDLEKKIIAQANKKSDDFDQDVKNRLKKAGGLLRPITLQDILTNLAKGSPEDLMALNPALSKEDVQNLYALAHQFLEQGVALKKMNRILALIESLEDRVTKGKSPQFLLQTLYNELSEDRHYNSLERSAFLAFEYFADISLRKNQVQLLEKFIKGDKKSANQIAELIMGSGKSAVLMPILGFMRADGTNISILIASSSLFPRLSREIDPTLQGAFATGLRTFYFDRNTTFDKLNLKNILGELKAIQKNRDCLIMTSKSLHCLLLKYIEKANEHYRAYPPLPSPSKELLLMGEILTLLSNEGMPLLDEADTLLSILHEVSFSLGEKTPLDPTQIEVIGLLYRELYLNSELNKLANIETSTLTTKGAPALTEEVYHKDIKEQLAKAFLKSLMDFESTDLRLEEKVRSRFSSLSKEDEELFAAYLTRDKTKVKESEEAYDKEDKEIRNIFAIASLEISSLLPHTLTRNLNENYGLDKERNGLTAIPFKASQTPSIGSQFASNAIMTNYTYQIYAKENIPFYIIEKEIKRLQIAARKEMEETGRNLKEVEAWKEFLILKGDLNLSLFHLNSQQIKQIVDKVNETTEKRLIVARKLILPEQQIYLKKLNSNAITLASFLNRISGFTGTLYNASSMHRKINPKPTKGTDSYTLSLLWENSFNAVIVAKGRTPEELRRELPLSVDMVIDAGGYFKDIDNEANAKKLFSQFEKPVVYFDKEGALVVYTKKGILPFDEAKLKKQDRITFLDQIFTTGANVLQHEDAEGLITIGSEMILRDLLQSSWRLRGLDKGQKARFFIDERTSQIIYEVLRIPKTTPLDFSAILAFCILNQSRKQGKDNEKGFYFELNEVKQKLLLDILLDKNLSEATKRKAFEVLSSSWIKETSEDADKQFGKLPEEIDSNKLIIDETEKLLSELKGLPKNEEALKEVLKVREHYLDKLPKTTLGFDHADSSTMEQEQQKIAELETEKQLDFFDDNSKVEYMELYFQQAFIESEFNPDLIGVTENRGLGDKKPIPAFSLTNFFENYEHLKPYADAFKDIDLSINMLTYPKTWNPVVKEDFQFFGPYRTSIHYIYIDQGKFRLVNNNEANFLIKQGKEDLIYNLGLGFLNPDLKLPKEDLIKVVKTKFLAGVSSYTLEEKKILREWLIESGVEKMEKFFLNYSLAGQTLHQEAYKQSGLKRFFLELKAEEKI